MGPARSENLCMYGVSMRENREIPRSPALLIERRAARGRLRPHARDERRGKSYCLVVPAKPSNKPRAADRAYPSGAEMVEERGQAEGRVDGAARPGLCAGEGVRKGAGATRAEPRAGTGEAVQPPLGSGLDHQGKPEDRLDARPEAGTQCGSPARWGLCGGPRATSVPTATVLRALCVSPPQRSMTSIERSGPTRSGA
jgi:hypothetical protein